MIGNAYEWVADYARSYPGNPEPFEHKGYHFVRGGCWDDGPANVRCVTEAGICHPVAVVSVPATATILDFE